MASKNTKFLYTLKTIKDSKLPLILSALFTLVADLIVLTALLAGGYSFLYLISPILLLLADLAFLFLGILTVNFRFRYAAKGWIIYEIALPILVAAGSFFLKLMKPEMVVITDLSFYLWVGVHILAFVAVWYTARFASHIHRKKLLALLSVVVVLFGALFYSFFLTQNGFFGQGAGERNVVYTLTADGEGYRAVSLEPGRSTTVVIPREFNGLPVKELDCSLLTASDIEDIYLTGGSLVTLVNGEALLSYQAEEAPTLHVEKTEYDLLREKLHRLASSTALSDACFEISNAVTIFDLPENEVAVSFEVDAFTYALIGGEVPETKFLTVGEVFSLEDYEGYRFLTALTGTTEDFEWSYENCDGYLFSGVSDENGQDPVGKAVGEDLRLTLRFDKIYRLSISEDNDTKYTIADSFRFDERADHTHTPYRYVTMASAEGLLSELEARTGFSLAFLYSLPGESEKEGFSSLPSLLASLSGSDVTIYPEWKLNAPSLTLSSSDGDNSILYGESITLNGAAVSPVNGIDLIYSWSYGGAAIGSLASYEMTLPVPNRSGVYTLTVTTAESELTSLSAAVTKTIEVSIGKKPLTFTWQKPAEHESTYDATTKQVSAYLPAGNLVAGDSGIDFILTEASLGGDAQVVAFQNAGSYSFTLALSNEWAEKYTIENPTLSFTLKKAQITPPAADTAEFVYNGSEQTYTLQAGDQYSITGNQRTDAGQYTVSVSLHDKSNYEWALATPSSEDREYVFSIAPLPVTVNWGASQFTYNGASQIPTASAQALGNTLNLSLTGNAVHAGSHQATATLMQGSGYTASNFVLTNATREFVIDPKVVTVKWTDVDYTYSASTILPTAKFDRINDGGVGTTPTGLAVSVKYVNEYSGINRGTHTAVASFINSTDANNYVLNTDALLGGTTEKEYTITPRPVTVEWSNTTLTYNGAAQKPTAQYENAYGVATSANLTVSGEKTNASSTNYTATALLNDPNYEITAGESIGFYIHARPVEILWEDTTLVYNGAAQKPKAYYRDVLGAPVYIRAALISGAKTDAGETGYEAYLNGTLDDTNYQVSSAISNNGRTAFQINPASVTVLWEESTLEQVYSGVLLKPSAYYCTDPLNPETRVNINSTDITGATDVGTYAVEAVVRNQNYVASGSSNHASLTITKKPVEIHWENTDSLVYDGATYQKPNAYFIGIGGRVDIDESLITGGMKAAGTGYTATVSALGEANRNYTIDTGIVGNGSTEFLIKKATVSLIWETNVFEYNGQNRTPTVYFNGVGNDGRINLSLSDFDAQYKNVCTDQPIEVTATRFANYELDNRYGEITITPYPVTVRWTASSVEYSGQSPLGGQSFQVYYNGKEGPVYLTSGIEFTKAGGGTPDGFDVGSYIATVTDLGDDNYKLDTSVANNGTKEFTVTKKPVSITWTWYGSTTGHVTYDRAPKTEKPVATLTGVLSPLSATIDPAYITFEGGTNAGNYTATITEEGREYYQNYSFTSSKTFVIDKALIYASGNAGSGQAKVEWVAGNSLGEIFYTGNSPLVNPDGNRLYAVITYLEGDGSYTTTPADIQIYNFNGTALVTSGFDRNTYKAKIASIDNPNYEFADGADWRDFAILAKFIDVETELRWVSQSAGMMPKAQYLNVDGSWIDIDGYVSSVTVGGVRKAQLNVEGFHLDDAYVNYRLNTGEDYLYSPAY